MPLRITKREMMDYWAECDAEKSRPEADIVVSGGEDDDGKEYPPTPTAKRFLTDPPKKYNVLIGGYGCGKTYALMKKMLSVASSLNPPDGMTIRSRFLMIRNTMGQLQNTTTKTFIDAMPAAIPYRLSNTPGGWRATADWDMQRRDGMRHVEMEVLFKSYVGRNEGDMQSLELTAGFANEVRELPAGVLQRVFTRTGRFPRELGAASRGMIFADTNQVDKVHWLYTDFYHPNGRHNKVSKIYIYPDSLGPDAEFPRPGMEEYIREMIDAAPSEQWINVNLRNQFGTAAMGLECYPRFSRQIHFKPYSPTPTKPLFLGADGGKNAAFVLFQEQDDGQLWIIDSWAVDAVRPNTKMPLVDSCELAAAFYAAKYPPHAWKWRRLSSCDPGFRSSGQNDNIQSFTILQEKFGKHGIHFAPARTHGNRPDERINAVNELLGQNSPIAGKMLMVADNCEWVARCMEMYQFPKNNALQTDGTLLYKDIPLKNAESHTAEAVAYGVLAPHVVKYAFKNITQKRIRDAQRLQELRRLPPPDPFSLGGGRL